MLDHKLLQWLLKEKKLVGTESATHTRAELDGVFKVDTEHVVKILLQTACCNLTSFRVDSAVNSSP